MIFFWPGKSDGGVLHWKLAPETAAISGIACDNEWLIVRSFDESPAQYRCATGIPIVLAPFSATPIVLWPGYTSGSSEELHRAIKVLHKNALKRDD